jgi:hypothetical protein
VGLRGGGGAKSVKLHVSNSMIATVGVSSVRCQ